MFRRWRVSLPVPGQAAYGAAKAFVLSYTEGLRNELRGTGVTATALCPGPVDTGFDDVAGFSAGERAATLPSFMWKSADEVARAAIDGLDAGKCRVVPGRINRLVAACCRFAPHDAAAAATRPTCAGKATELTSGLTRGRYTDYWTRRGSGYAGQIG